MLLVRHLTQSQAYGKCPIDGSCWKEMREDGEMEKEETEEKEEEEKERKEEGQEGNKSSQSVSKHI